MNTRLGIFVLLALLAGTTPVFSAEETCPCTTPAPNCWRRLIDRLHHPLSGCTACQNDRMFVFGNEYQYFREFYFPLPPEPHPNSVHGYLNK
jgi:hypothetical protein